MFPHRNRQLKSTPRPERRLNTKKETNFSWQEENETLRSVLKRYRFFHHFASVALKPTTEETFFLQLSFEMFFRCLPAKQQKFFCLFWFCFTSFQVLVGCELWVLFFIFHLFRDSESLRLWNYLISPQEWRRSEKRQSLKLLLSPAFFGGRKTIYVFRK